jgi:hypothetical protein
LTVAQFLLPGESVLYEAPDEVYYRRTPFALYVTGERLLLYAVTGRLAPGERPEGTHTRPAEELERRVSAVPVRRRDLRVKGRTGDTQLVIGNPELEALVVDVLEAMGAPADVRTIRSLVMSRLPVLDIRLTQLYSASYGEDGGRVFEPADAKPSPEQEVLLRDGEGRACEHVEEFLTRLSAAVNKKARQYERILGVLWHSYLSDEHPTQMVAAARLGVSDSLVSDYRRRIEGALRSLSLTSVEEARVAAL